MPWSPRTRQEEGRKTERKVVRDRGGRVHPNSGAGHIKDDGSSDTELIEVKDAIKSHTIKASDLFALFRRAAKQSKDPVYVIQFRDHSIRAEVHITITK